jgi:excisionase family DNA binding protein
MAELLKLTEVAQELGISEPTARRYVKTGRLASVFVGGRYRVYRDAVDEFLRQAEVRPGEDLPKPEASRSSEAGQALPRSREEAAFVIVPRVVEDFSSGVERLQMVVKWNVPPEEREHYKKVLRKLPWEDYLEEEMSPQAAVLLETASG